MASIVDAAVGAVVALLFWTALGFSIGRRIFPRTLALPIAPALGWAAHSAATLPVYLLLGFSALGVTALAAAALIASIAAMTSACPGKVDTGFPKRTCANRRIESASRFNSIGMRSRRVDRTQETQSVPGWAYLAAAALALAPAAAVAPEHAGDSVLVAEPIFDHAKAAIIDAMTRLGLPPANPFFGELGERGRLAYYYLWYFSAAQLALPLGLTGWEADISLTWFSAFSSLTLMMGLASWFGRSRLAAILVVLFAATGSLRFVLGGLFGSGFLERLLAYPTGFAGWLFQSAWVPQHLMSANCVVIAMLLIARLGQRASFLLLAALVLVVIAGFESSTWIGGITFVISALIAFPIFLAHMEASHRRRFVLGLAAAAGLSVVLAAPLLLDQIASLRLRGGGAPIVIDHFPVLGNSFPLPLRRVLDLPAYWLVLLPVEFPATYIAGTIAFITLLASRTFGAQRRRAAMACAVLAGASLVIPWLFLSTLGENNDLGLRAVLPGAMMLIVFAAAGLALWLSQGRRIAAAAALCGVVLGFPDAVQITYGNLIARPRQPGKEFAQTPEMWEAVRRHAGPAERIGNNPLYLVALTPWPVNLSWALISNRSSCFAGRELALVYAPLTAARREEIAAEFTRVFSGDGSEHDVRALAVQFGCRVVVLTAQDGAWQRDPFAASAFYRLVEARPDRWRIYRATVP
jgi:hypothetical protein